MGGFVFDLSNKYVSDTFLPEYDYLTVTPRGVAMLASLGLLPEISAEEIYDKSKSDGLAKAIVILQALWMFIQCIARPAQGLYITLLEINTVAHILCAFIVFIFWWSKPRNVTQPTKVGGEWSQGLVAYMYMSSKMSGHQSVHPWRRLRQMTRPELDWLALAPSGTLSSCKSELGDSSKQRTIFGDRQVASEANDQDAIEADSNPMQETKEPKALEVEISGKRYHIVDRTLDASHQRRGNTDMEMATTISQDVSRMERWISAAKALRSFSQLSKRHLQDSESQPRNKYRAFKTPAGIERDYTWLKFTTEQLCVPVMGNWPTSNLCSGLSGTIMGSVLWFSSMGYGAIHAAGWNDYFPTTTEKWLWRASAVYLAFSGLIWLQINALGSLFPKFNAFWDKIMAARAGLLVNLLIGILCTICGLAYGFARIYLVVESFISLRQLPISAFETPEWTALIPHL
ncbi:MAG: hypothetical protein M1814_003408 [Vezdaea aestivalis]|nr:MAG: hypothetical protein M1814_003408 [Vezdaea aestivalis]